MVNGDYGIVNVCESLPGLLPVVFADTHLNVIVTHFSSLADHSAVELICFRSAQKLGARNRILFYFFFSFSKYTKVTLSLATYLIGLEYKAPVAAV